MKAYKRKLHWGWFDIMGIEAGVEYIKRYRHACRIR